MVESDLICVGYLHCFGSSIINIYIYIYIHIYIYIYTYIYIYIYNFIGVSFVFISCTDCYNIHVEFM